MTKQVRSGEKLSFSARIQNDVNEFFNARQLASSQGQAGDVLQHGLLARVKNNSGANLERGELLTVDSIGLDPEDVPTAAWKMPLLYGTATAFGHDGRVVVLAEPIADGNIGLATLTGMCLALVNCQDTGHRFASVAYSTSKQLISCDAGCVRIFPTGTGVRLTMACISPFAPPNIYALIPSGGLAAATSSGAVPSVTECDRYAPDAADGGELKDTGETVDVYHYGAAVDGSGDHDFIYMQCKTDTNGHAMDVEYCNTP